MLRAIFVAKGDIISENVGIENEWQNQLVPIQATQIQTEVFHKNLLASGLWRFLARRRLSIWHLVKNCLWTYKKWLIK